MIRRNDAPSLASTLPRFLLLADIHPFQVGVVVQSHLSRLVYLLFRWVVVLGRTMMR